MSVSLDHVVTNPTTKEMPDPIKGKTVRAWGVFSNTGYKSLLLIYLFSIKNSSSLKENIKKNTSFYICLCQFTKSSERVAYFFPSEAMASFC